MNEDNHSTNSYKRNVARLLELAKTDAQIQAAMPKESVREAACKPSLSYDKVISVFFEGYADRPALGERNYKVIKCNNTRKTIRNYTESFNTNSYHELHKKIQSLAMAWRSHPNCNVQRDDFVCIMGFASIDYAVIDIACAYSKAITVPLSSKSSINEIREILNNIQPTAFASRIQDLLLCVEHSILQKSIEHIIVFDFDSRVDEEIETLNNAITILKNKDVNTKILLLKDLIEYGKDYTFSFLPIESNENDKTAMIMHSSGSTGKPKGACISANALINTWQGQPEQLPKITLVMAPFNHNMGRNEMYEALNAGGTAYFTLKDDLSTVFKDIQLTNPTSLVFFPRLLQIVYQHFQLEVSNQLNIHDDKIFVEEIVKSRMKSTTFGHRLLFGAVASAPISNKIKQFISECFDIYLVNGYSTTETASGGLAINGKINRKIVIDYKLIDAPELGYFITDEPHPRGEFCVKTRFGITQYYNQPEATEQLFDDDGYHLTGDIVEEIEFDKINIIDRRVNILKLSQGEYVALGRLGKLFEGESALINQIFIYGNSQRSYLLAIVVPEMKSVQETLNKTHGYYTIKQLINNELIKIGHENNLKRFEIPQDFIIEMEPFSQINQMLSAINKYRTPAIIKRYKPLLESIYEEHDRIKQSDLNILIQTKNSLSTKENLIQLLKINLGIEVSKKDELKTFYELGGDSLAAVLFSMHIEELYGVSIGADAILSPRNNIQRWVKTIENFLLKIEKTPDFYDIHGKKPNSLRKKDLELDKFLGIDLVNNAKNLPSSNHPPRTVLLTGSTGFIGHILCLDWMEELAKIDGKLICIIRAQDDDAARKRLEQQFIGIDASMEQKYFDLSEKHLKVLAGDISETFLGLNQSTFIYLANEIDKICHAGALVNHRLSYRHLFGPNVKGTCELIRLALSRKLKPIDFISTIGVDDYLDDANGKSETSTLKSEVTLSNKYASGYIASKWAGECLLRQANFKFGLPANIFRCDMIMPDRRYSGQFNCNDIITRLLYSIIITQTAPNTLYEINQNNHSSDLHFTGLAVDILSNAIIKLNEPHNNSLNVYNAMNFNSDSISLDTFIDWIESGGFTIYRESSHKIWHERIGKKLEILSYEQRKHTIADILDAFEDPFPAEKILPDCSNFRALLKEFANDPSILRLSESYLHRYLNSIISKFN